MAQPIGRRSWGWTTTAMEPGLGLTPPMLWAFSATPARATWGWRWAETQPPLTTQRLSQPGSGAIWSGRTMAPRSWFMRTEFRESALLYRDLLTTAPAGTWRSALDLPIPRPRECLAWSTR